ncbi:MAG: ATPase [Oxalobacter sp.]|nr:MAG: ATPase [Oxalobacter sp.]
MKQDPTYQAYRPGQHPHVFSDIEQDPFADRKKLPEPSTCRDCGATYSKGNWKWGITPQNTHPTICSACKRIRENMPAGFVSIQGPFAREHKDEILNLVRHFAARQKTEHPLKRIISISNDGHGQIITTTDIHLARGIGGALQKAYKGELDYQYNHAEYLLRVRWLR